MGPLEGVKIVEIAGLGPTPFCGMLLADMGAEIIRIERKAPESAGVDMPGRFDLMHRSRPAMPVDLKSKHGVELVLRLSETADVLFEGFRPGVMERLGLGPDACMARNPRLVYGRMTGWGQDGPWADRAGHDPNYIGLAGVLTCIGERGRGPVYPMNLVGDFGGGGAYLAMGILAALLEVARSGKGQVVDAAIIDGASSLMTMAYGFRAGGFWQDRRGSNLLDGGAPFARTYLTADGKYIVVAAVEPKFFRRLLDEIGVDDLDASRQHDPAYWPQIEARLSEVFKSQTRSEWSRQLDDADACFAPVLELAEVAEHPHVRARDTIVSIDGIEQPAPAPRFSRTPSAIQSPAGQHRPAAEILEDWGLSPSEIQQWIKGG